MSNLQEFKSYLQGKIEKGKHYYSTVGSLDIETTKFETDEGETANYCYCWSFSLDGVIFTFGRDPEDFFRFLLDLQLNKKLIIYVQWLGFEYNNLKWLFDKYITEDEVIFKRGNKNKPLKITGDKVIFKCSNALSGMSLEQMGEEIGLPKRKDLDYSIPRNRETPMTEEEIGYCLRDVEIVCKWVLNAMRILECRVNDLPLTAAGMYNVALDKAEWHAGARRKYAVNKYRNWEVGDYEKFRSAFRGGLIVFDEKKQDKYISKVLHADIKSAYPALQVMGRFPKLFSHSYGKISKDKQKTMIDDVDNWGTLAEFTFTGLKLKPQAPCCIIKDLYMASVYKAYMTNLEFKIMTTFYDFTSVEWTDFQASQMEELPKAEKEVNLKLFEEKEKAKGTDAYNIRKVQLNSGYGNKCKRMYKLEEDETEDEIEYVKTLDYYYPIGVWISARQRYIMAMLIWELGKDFIYCNTDGLFCKDTPHAREVINNYNSAISFADSDKLGRFEIESVHQFYIIGASRYAVINKDRTVDVTFSGTDKKDSISIADLQKYSNGGGFIIPNGAYKAYSSSGVFKGVINGVRVVTYNYLYKEATDMEVSKLGTMFTYKEDK